MFGIQEWVVMARILYIHSIHLGAVHKLCRLKGGGGKILPILLSKKTTKRGGGGQKLLILRRHSLWTAPYETHCTVPALNF